MGRALKIAKPSPGSGNSGASVNIDVAYPNFGSLTNTVYNTQFKPWTLHSILVSWAVVAPTAHPAQQIQKLPV